MMRDDAYVKLMVRLLTSIKQQVAEAVRRGETLEQTRKSVNFTEFRQAFAGDSKLKSFFARQSDFELATRNSLSRRRRNRVSRAPFLGHDAGFKGLAILFLAILGFTQLRQVNKVCFFFKLKWKAWTIAPTVPRAKRGVQCLPKIGILAMRNVRHENKTVRHLVTAFGHMVVVVSSRPPLFSTTLEVH
jgi:hypothetical protein